MASALLPTVTAFKVTIGSWFGLCIQILFSIVLSEKICPGTGTSVFVDNVIALKMPNW